MTDRDGRPQSDPPGAASPSTTRPGSTSWRGLHAAGVALVSTGGSAALIEALGLPVTKVEDLTGFPECLDGRVKTLHPRVHAGILADRRLDAHVAAARRARGRAVRPGGLNLYPFPETVASGASPDECVEQIDIGGPSMVRAAAKNHPSVAIVTSPPGTPTCWPPRGGGFTLAERSGWPRRRSPTPRRTTWRSRRGWATSLDRHSDGSGFPGWVGATWDERGAAVRREPAPAGRAVRRRLGPGGLATAEQLHGKEMSYNNYVDTDAARRAAYDHGTADGRDHQARQPVRHRGRRDVAEAHRKAHACDPVSAFGGVIAVNRRCPWRWPSRSRRSSPR